MHIVTLLALVLLGTLLRLEYNATAIGPAGVHSDAAKYVQYANNLRDYSTFSKDTRNTPPVPDAYWAPGYPAFLAVVTRLSEQLDLNRLDTFLNAQVFLGAQTIFLTWMLARLCLPGLWPLLPTLLITLSPHHIAIGQNVITETLFSFMLLVSLLLFFIALNDRSKLSATVAGASFAATWLVNPVSLLVAPLLILIALRRRRTSNAPPQIAPLTLLLALLPLVLIFTLWNVRTMVVVPESAPTASDRLLNNAVIGLHQDFFAMWRANKRDKNSPAKIDERYINGSWATFAHVASVRVAENPIEMTRWYLVIKPMLLWSWEVQHAFQDIYIYPLESSLYHQSFFASITYGAMKLLHVPLCIFALLGGAFLLARREGHYVGIIYVYATLVCICAIYVATQAAPRFSIPLRPLMYIAASFGIRELVWALRSHWRKDAVAHRVMHP